MDQGPLPWRVLDDEDRVDARPPSLAHSGRADAPAGDRRSGTLPAVRWIAVIALAIGLVGVAVAIVASGPQPVALVETGVGAVSAEGPSPAGDRPATSPSAASIVVHVAGAVRRPGLVRLTDGARVADAIDAAGGLGPMADPERVGRDLNLAERLTDGERVVVPARDDPADASAVDGTSGGMGPGPGGAPDGLVDLNHADATALDSLPGIGPVTAAKIIAARTERPFTSLDELVQRKVVSASTLEKFRDRAVVR
jgi:competence protein ComEA